MEASRKVWSCLTSRKRTNTIDSLNPPDKRTKRGTVSKKSKGGAKSEGQKVDESEVESPLNTDGGSSEEEEALDKASKKVAKKGPKKTSEKFPQASWLF